MSEHHEFVNRSVGCGRRFASTIDALDPSIGLGRVGAGIVAFAGCVATRQPDGFKPDRFDLTGSEICLVGLAVIMYASG
jgi:drug/metabolite transporter superfamily protein YnfA